MRRKVCSLILVGVLGFVSACSLGDNEKNEPDVKPETTETTVGDAIGQDAEIQLTTSSEEENDSTSDQITTPEQTTETTTAEAVTTTEQLTTAKQTATTEKETTTVRQTTTGQIETVDRETITNSAMIGKDRGTVTLDITASDAAIKRAEKIIEDIITSSMSDYQCVKAIHDYLVKNIDYGLVGAKDNLGSDLAHRAEGALCYDTAVCQGYAEAFELLCAQVGIQAHMIYGEAIAADGTQSHAWNVVKVNGEWYQIDCTWDDPFVNGAVVRDGENITYTYFLLTDKEMYVDHVPDMELSKDAKVCTSTLFNGVGERLSLEMAMREPSVIVKTTKSFYQAIENYAVQKIYSFDIAIPVTEAVSQQGIADAVTEGLNASGMTGQYGFSYTSMNVVNYVVYHITISK